MHYDPIKQTIGQLFNRWLFSRKLFYRLLDILLLRTWHIHRELKKFFRLNKVKTGVSVLDAGCGFGQYTYYISRKRPAWNVTGIDIKEDELASCRVFFTKSHLPHATFKVADLVAYKQDESYDLIISVDVMEHIENDRAVFKNFFQSLKPGGLLMINTPSDKGGSGVSAKGESSFIEEHVRDGYGKEEMAKKLQEAGFQKINMAYTYGWPGHISWLLSMKYPIRLLGVSKVFLLILPFYYMLVMPCALILNCLDLRLEHKSGTGLLVNAWK
jgi:2-polyprenyl-3-methyl-5-hydroxy-6-metoxy-1,4-benzoquinol methylase